MRWTPNLKFHRPASSSRLGISIGQENAYLASQQEVVHACAYRGDPAACAMVKGAMVGGVVLAGVATAGAGYAAAGALGLSGLEALAVAGAVGTVIDVAVDYSVHQALGEGEFDWTQSIATNTAINAFTFGAGGRLKHIGMLRRLESSRMASWAVTTGARATADAGITTGVQAALDGPEPGFGANLLGA